ncbi:MAG TPA: nucleoside triphosphate pyrophosphohydrolase, partial [Beijerinckiaceae bacterium]
ARGDLLDLKEELGDLLLQVVFHARMAEEAGAFDFGDVVEGITAKLLRRHPHVFGDAGTLSTEAVNALWGEIKRAEKEARRRERGLAGEPADGAADGVLAGVPAGLPALARADKLTRKAATVGFDWPNAREVVAKIEEEVEEVRDALETGSPAEVEAEIGDLLFAVANLARHAGVDPETALRAANAKFERRFAAIEQALAAAGRQPADASLAEMEELWVKAKEGERGS